MKVALGHVLTYNILGDVISTNCGFLVDNENCFNHSSYTVTSVRAFPLPLNGSKLKIFAGRVDQG